MDAFMQARIAGNKKLADDLAGRIRKLMDDAKNLGEGIKKPFEEIAEIIKDTSFKSPDLALRGSQAAARGELGLANVQDQVLKVNQDQLKEQRKINQNVEALGLKLPNDAHFGMAGAVIMGGL